MCLFFQICPQKVWFHTENSQNLVANTHTKKTFSCFFPSRFSLHSPLCQAETKAGSRVASSEAAHHLLTHAEPPQDNPPHANDKKQQRWRSLMMFLNENLPAFCWSSLPCINIKHKHQVSDNKHVCHLFHFSLEKNWDYKIADRIFRSCSFLFPKSPNSWCNLVKLSCLAKWNIIFFPNYVINMSSNSLTKLGLSFFTPIHKCIWSFIMFCRVCQIKSLL